MVNYLMSHKSLFEDWLINTKKLKNAEMNDNQARALAVI